MHLTHRSLLLVLSLSSALSFGCSNDDASSAEGQAGRAVTHQAGRGSGATAGASSATGGSAGDASEAGGSAGRGGSDPTAGAPSEAGAPSTGGSLGGSGRDGGGGGGAGGTGPSGGADTGGGGADTSDGGAGAGDGGSGSGSGGANTAGDAGAPSTDPTPVTIAVIGASSAAGKNLPEGGYSLADSWVNRYAVYLDAERPGSTITNLAVSGTNTFHALPTGTTNPSGQAAVDPAHNITAALATNPDAVIVAFPSQSQVEMGMADTVIDNLETIVAEAAKVGVPVWISTNQPNKNTVASVTAQLAYRDLVLSTFGAHALDFWTPLADEDGLAIPAYLNSYDDVHPSAEGHRVLFEKVVAAHIEDAL